MLSALLIFGSWRAYHDFTMQVLTRPGQVLSRPSACGQRIGYAKSIVNDLRNLPHGEWGNKRKSGKLRAAYRKKWGLSILMCHVTLYLEAPSERAGSQSFSGLEKEWCNHLSFDVDMNGKQKPSVVWVLARCLVKCSRGSNSQLLLNYEARFVLIVNLNRRAKPPALRAGG